MRENIGEFNRFKAQIFLYGMVFAAVVEAGSLVVLGPNLDFLYGLVLGTCICIVNFNILALAGKKVLNTRKPMFGYAGYILRLCIYGMAFYMALKVSVISGIASILGFMTLTLSILFIHMVRPALTGKRSRDAIIVPAEQESRELTGNHPESYDNTGVGDSIPPDNYSQPGVGAQLDNSVADAHTTSEDNNRNSFSDDDQEKKKGRRLYKFYKEVFGYAFDEDDEQTK